MLCYPHAAAHKTERPDEHHGLCTHFRARVCLLAVGEMLSKKKKVCVVGAGVSGLVSVRELRREGHDVTVMEQSGGVGGQWLYDPKVDAGDPLGLAGVQSSIYASLRLIIPREVMSFSDFPFYPRDGGDGLRYPGHGEFLRYVRDYCDAFGIIDAVRLNTTVLRVAADGNSRWRVRSCTRQRGEDDAVVTTEEEEEVFDAVVVAVGQYTQPRLPTINGNLSVPAF
ncbi:hypothetical protein PR202_ga28630 [Eleusine coracana subsp. coracana]|uniref:Flavin-containing monooxygenase n=1 Tax=Eleusine coracana subsp. coracana TaxID=191504 RepID=A0AAV5DJC0_ELECO|nr:hypothetical protein PR202_ga28630 [Eleusine coracana subsp. coracana]